MRNRQIDQARQQIIDDVYRKLARQIDLQTWKEWELDREKRGDQKGINVWSTAHMKSLIHALNYRSCGLDRSFAVEE
jgi:hypothetical protein